MPHCPKDARVLLLCGVLLLLSVAPSAAQHRVASPAPEAVFDRLAAAVNAPGGPFVGFRDFGRRSGPVARPYENGETIGCEPRTVLTACDGWTGQDKVKHVVFAFSVTASVYYLMKNTTNLSRSQSLLLSFGTMTAIGLTKEWLDWENDAKRCFSAGDMTANGVGMLLATGFVLAF